MTAPLDALLLRPATVRDAAPLAAVLVEGFETYRTFAPPGWQAPTAELVTEELRTRLGRPSVWCLLAEHDAHVAGYVALLPAAEARRPVSDPRLAHFWMLFVRGPWWGTGLASRLHAEACAAAAERGFTAMRLFTPADQARARRFYERERWTLAAGPIADDELGMAIVEYRRRLDAGVSSARGL